MVVEADLGITDLELLFYHFDLIIFNKYFYGFLIILFHK